MKTLWLVRHGESTAQTGEDLGIDTPISDFGALQARELQNALENIQFDAAFVSPLKRARQTYEYSSLNCPKIFFDNRLIEEMPKGVYSQILPYDELPEYGEKLFFDLWELEAHSRAKLFLAGLKQTPYKNILIVSHAGFLNRFLYAVLENGAKKGNEPPPSPNDLYFGVNNCGISSLILYDQEKTLSDVVLFWNNTSHLAGLHRSEQED